MELATPHTEEVIKLVDKVGDFEWFVQLDVGLLKVLLKKQPQFLVKQLLFVFKSSTWIMGQLAQICIFSVKIIIWFCRGIH
ncbi:hypothetical protein E1A91_D01G180600v1 [Gossypium mustelinum]|uniref:Uncharacterized protein n=1 Tax=Gossypium mustelinum TaxID=34275 RepID=A0A5D2WAT3_GOSMU|nr:hypothetical protein E1A91_D01G180600v1 [Gossypium mustelinum]